MKIPKKNFKKRASLYVKENLSSVYLALCKIGMSLQAKINIITNIKSC